MEHQSVFFSWEHYFSCSAGQLCLVFYFFDIFLFLSPIPSSFSFSYLPLYLCVMSRGSAYKTSDVCLCVSTQGPELPIMLESVAITTNYCWQTHTHMHTVAWQWHKRDTPHHAQTCTNFLSLSLTVLLSIPDSLNLSNLCTTLTKLLLTWSVAVEGINFI